MSIRIDSYQQVYNQQALEKNISANCGRQYQQCSIGVMDTIADPDITFDEKGISNYYYEYIKVEKEKCLKGKDGLKKQKYWANKIIKSKKIGEYNCILGLSGGADSTYLAYLAMELGLCPLLVHFDYGWNSETATINVENVVKNTGFDLYTLVMDWPEFKNLQRSYFKASVIDLDVPADHMIFGSLYQTAKNYGIKYVLNGNNVWSEHTLPKTWNYNKFDIINLKNIHKTFENTSLKHLPALGLWQSFYYELFNDIKKVCFLDWQEYNLEEIKNKIENKLEWKSYGWKHHESVFTRFYQGYILLRKFNVDKRKAHLSNLIFSEQITKNDAEEELLKPPYPLKMQEDDFSFVAKKLGFTEDEFEGVLLLNNFPHQNYGTDYQLRQRYYRFMKFIKPFSTIVKRLLRR